MYKPSKNNYIIKNDEFEEINFKNKKKKKNNFSMIIVIIIAILFGLFVFFISNLLFGPKEAKTKSNDEKQKTEISIKDNQIISLYNYVTYGVNDERYNLFIKNKKVTQESISNLDKFLYASQFITKDDFKDETTKEDKTKVYSLSTVRLKEAMENFFGSKVEYVSTSEVPITFNFEIEQKNTGTLAYDNKLGSYTISFINKVNKNNNNFLKPYYTKLKSAFKDSSEDINIIENIIYVSYQKNENSTYNYKVYSDYEHTIVIDAKENVSEKELQENKINIDDYQNTASTITYKFKEDTSGNYYFYSSKIDY